MRAYMDNVILQLEPVEKITAGGIVIPDQSRNAGGFRRTRQATVMASGRGYYGRESREQPGGVFIENEAKPGDTVLVDYLAGTDYSWDLAAPRHNKDMQFDAIGKEKGDFRIVRHDELLCFVRDGKPYPTNDNLIVKRRAAKEMTDGGLYIPKSAQKQPLEGEVIYLGPGRMGGDGKRRPWDIEVGDSVIFNQYCGTEIRHDGQEYLLIKEENVLGVIDG